MSFLLMICLILGLYFLKKPKPPTLPYPRISSLIPLKKSLKIRLSSLPNILNISALGILMAAFTDPHLNQKLEKRLFAKNATEGIAIYLVLDQSGSMQEPVIKHDRLGRRQYLTKLDLLKQMTRQFIEERPEDLIGILAFARSSHVLAPLTLDHQEVLSKLSSLTQVQDKEQEGTAIGNALFNATNLIISTRHFAKEKEAYTINESIIILVTDGFQDPNPLDLNNKRLSMGIMEAAEYAKEHRVKLYMINVEPKTASEPFLPHRRLMQRATELTGGKFYLADNPDILNQVYEEINQLQKSAIPSVLFETKRISFYPYLIAISMGLLALSVLLETTLLRRAP